MKIANANYLSWVVGALNTATDDEVASIETNDDEAGTRSVIKLLIKPDFDALADESKLMCKNSLRYYLTTGNAPFYDILDQQYEWPVDPPTDPKKFFAWIWKELFPNEEYDVTDVEGWEESRDALGALAMREKST